MSYLGASDIIYSDVIDSFISEKLKYESSVIESLTKKPGAILFTHTHTNTKEPYVCAWSTPRKKEKTNSGFWHFCALTMLGISLSQLQLGKMENPLGVTVGSVYWWEEGCKSCNHVWKIQYWLPSQLLQGKDLCKMLKYLLFEVMKYL